MIFTGDDLLEMETENLDDFEIQEDVSDDDEEDEDEELMRPVEISEAEAKCIPKVTRSKTKALNLTIFPEIASDQLETEPKLEALMNEECPEEESCSVDRSSSERPHFAQSFSTQPSISGQTSYLEIFNFYS